MVDSNNHRVKLAAVSWYGAEEQDYVVAGLEAATLDQIASEIKCYGFNAVRLPWSNQMYESNPLVGDAMVAANPQLKGLRAMDVFDAVVNALAKQGLLIVLDNHVSAANWCCSNTDGNQLWYNSAYPESSWIADWQGMARRYANQPAVIGVDLRNEPRATATWGGDPAYDWHAAAERGGNAVLASNANLLIFVEGVNYAGDLTGVAQLPVALIVSNRLVYSAHDYSWYHNGVSSSAQLQQQWNQKWGYIATAGQAYTAPVWVGEFGTCHTDSSCLQGGSSQGSWFASFIAYLQQTDFDWSYWTLNGTEATGASRSYGSEETYGILNTSWTAPAQPEGPALLTMLQSIRQP